MPQSVQTLDQKIEVSLAEYTLLKEARSLLKKQVGIFRILEAEENFRNGKSSRFST